MSARDPRSILLEADYAKLILADLLELNEQVAAAARPLTTLPALALGLMLSPTVTPADAELLARITGTSGDALRVLATMHEPIMRILELLGGRLTVLEAESNDDDGEGGEPS